VKRGGREGERSPVSLPYLMGMEIQVGVKRAQKITI